MTIVNSFKFLIGFELREGFEAVSTADYDAFVELSKNEPAVTVRHSMRLITFVVKHFNELDRALRSSLGDHQCFDPVADSVRFLENEGHEVFPPNATAHGVFERVMDSIAGNIDNCKSLFPCWVDWTWIKARFILPGYHQEKNVLTDIKRYYSSFSAYPFGIWIYLPKPEQNGNILRSDEALLHTLAHQHDSEFTDSWRLRPDSFGLNNFYVGTSAVAVVDSENVDPFRLGAVLKSFEKREFMPLAELVVVCDENNVSAWSYVQELLPPKTKLRYVHTTRLNPAKSIVDHMVTAELVKSVCASSFDHIILFASDSDYVAVLDGLFPTTSKKISVIYEPDKTAESTLSEYHRIGIELVNAFSCTDCETEMVETLVLRKLISDKLDQLLSKDVETLTDELFLMTRLPKERLVELIGRILATLRFRINERGKIEVMFDDQ